MTRYLTSYRFFVLCKAGLSAAYLWVCWDFLRINRALEGGLQVLFPNLRGETVTDNVPFNYVLTGLLEFLSQPPAIWLYFLLSPGAVALYVWGRYRWLQFGVGIWLWLSIVGFTARANMLMSTADFWLSWCFLLYIVAVIITPKGQWETSQPALSRETWRKNPILHSEYALLLVVLQFTVYFYAGINKLIDGWIPWTTGTALQNLSYDLSMRDYARGVPVPFAISLVLGYVTLFQRLVVPFGFFIMRYRGWAVLILASMHAGYEALMEVAIFPLVGLSGLLLIIPPRELALPLFSRPSLKPGKRLAHYLKKLPRPRLHPAQWALYVFIIGLLLIEPIVNTQRSPNLSYTEIKLGTLLHWTMFSDGGVRSKVRLHLKFRTRDSGTGQIRTEDVTDLPFRLLPNTWRTRFYQQTLLFEAMENNHATGDQISHNDYLAGYIRAASNLYAEDHPGHPPIQGKNLSLDLFHPPGEPSASTAGR